MSLEQTHPGAEPVVSFERVSKAYGTIRAVDELSLELWPGETVALLGPSGAGKSTSLDMLLALRKPTGGRIRMFGSDPYHAVKSGRVGAMLQSGGLMPEVTVRELVTLVTGFHPRPLPVDQTLRRAGIADIAGRRVERLSGGQAERVRFAPAVGQERAGGIIETGALRALALAASGRESEAVTVLAGMLTLAAQQGHVRVFADEGPPMAALLGRLIAAQRADQTAAGSRWPSRPGSGGPSGAPPRPPAPGLPGRRCRA